MMKKKTVRFVPQALGDFDDPPELSRRVQNVVVNSAPKTVPIYRTCVNLRHLRIAVAYASP